jgi:hypothetical protein
VDYRAKISIILPVISSGSMSVLQIDMALTEFHLQSGTLPV